MPKRLDWARVRPRLCTLYANDHSLKYVKEVLQREHGFEASERALRLKLKEWNCLRGTPTSQLGHEVLHEPDQARNYRKHIAGSPLANGYYQAQKHGSYDLLGFQPRLAHLPSSEPALGPANCFFPPPVGRQITPQSSLPLIQAGLERPSSDFQAMNVSYQGDFCTTVATAAHTASVPQAGGSDAQLDTATDHDFAATLLQPARNQAWEAGKLPHDNHNYDTTCNGPFGLVSHTMTRDTGLPGLSTDTSWVESRFKSISSLRVKLESGNLRACIALLDADKAIDDADRERLRQIVEEGALCKLDARSCSWLSSASMCMPDPEVPDSSSSSECHGQFCKSIRQFYVDHGSSNDNIVSMLNGIPDAHLQELLPRLLKHFSARSSKTAKNLRRVSRCWSFASTETLRHVATDILRNPITVESTKLLNAVCRLSDLHAESEIEWLGRSPAILRQLTLLDERSCYPTAAILFENPCKLKAWLSKLRPNLTTGAHDLAFHIDFEQWISIEGGTCVQQVGQNDKQCKPWQACINAHTGSCRQGRTYCQDPHKYWLDHKLEDYTNEGAMIKLDSWLQRDMRPLYTPWNAVRKKRVWRLLQCIVHVMTLHALDYAGTSDGETFSKVTKDALAARQRVGLPPPDTIVSVSARHICEFLPIERTIHVDPHDLLAKL